MVVQGQWEKDSPLLQLPHITPQLAAAAAAKGVSTVFDLIEMEDEDRRELLQVCACTRSHHTVTRVTFTVHSHAVKATCGVQCTLNACMFPVSLLPFPRARS